MRREQGELGGQGGLSEREADGERARLLSPGGDRKKPTCGAAKVGFSSKRK